MESTQLDQVIGEMRQELKTAEATAETLRAGIAALELMQQRRVAVNDSPRSTIQVQELAPPSPRQEITDDEVDPTAPRGSQAVEIILRDSPPGKWWAVSELADEFKKRGWGPASKNPREAVRANASRLVATKEDEFEGGRGKYRRRPEPIPVQHAPPTAEEREKGGGDDQEGVKGDRHSELVE